MRYYKPRIHLTVDEMIECFTSHTLEIINILTKPTPKGFKIWVLANQGYILNWMFYVKSNNKGLVNLNMF